METHRLTGVAAPASRAGTRNEKFRRAEGSPISVPKVKRKRKGGKLITWVLAEEPDLRVRRVIEIVEERVGSEDEVMWLSPGPIEEPVQD